MFLLVLTGLTLATAPALPAPESWRTCLDNFDVTSQQEQCLKKKLEQGNNLVAAFMKEISAKDKAAGRAERNAQGLWMKYRDAQCYAEGVQFEGGSLQLITSRACLVKLTLQRAQELKDMAKALNSPIK